MIDKNYCMSSFLAFRYIEKEDVEFYEGMKHNIVPLPNKNDCIRVSSVEDLDKGLKEIFRQYNGEKLGLLLSGGMDSGCLSAYMPKGSNAYTFRFNKGKFAAEELRRAEKFAEINELNLKYVDIDFSDVISCLPKIMMHKGAPVHSIEPQIYLAAMQAKKDGIEHLIIGDAADYVFYGMDGLLSQDWDYEAFINRSIYIKPEKVLKEPADVYYLYEPYREGEKIDFIGFFDKSITEESYSSYDNAIRTAGMSYSDPYERFSMAEPVDLQRVRNGESKYYIRQLYKRLFPQLDLPEKVPMPRLVDEWFKDWKGPIREEFRDDIVINEYSGNQRWLLFCLEMFLNMNEKY